MIHRIKTHNSLNGIKLCIVEFVTIAVIISPFAVFYIFHGQGLYAFISTGIMLNCFTVAALGLRQLAQKDPDVGWRRLKNKKEREQIDREHPNLALDTGIVTLTTLIPCVLAAWVGIDWLVQRRRSD